MSRPEGTILEIAIQKKTPILRSARIICCPKGITKWLMKTGTTTTAGPILNNQRSLLSGTISSFNRSLIPSARD